MQLGELQGIEAELRDIGYQIVAISADRPAMLQASLTQHELGFQLLSDSSMTAAAEFGLAWRMAQPMVEKYVAYGIDLEAASGRNHHVLPVPAVFIVGTDGVVRFQYVNPDHRFRLDADILIAAAKAQMKRMSSSSD